MSARVYVKFCPIFSFHVTYQELHTQCKESMTFSLHNVPVPVQRWFIYAFMPSSGLHSSSKVLFFSDILTPSFSLSCHTDFLFCGSITPSPASLQEGSCSSCDEWDHDSRCTTWVLLRFTLFHFVCTRFPSVFCSVDKLHSEDFVPRRPCKRYREKRVSQTFRLMCRRGGFS